MLHLRPAAWLPIGAFLVAAWAGPAAAADPPKLKELRLQQVGTATYFHAAYEAPANLNVPPLQMWWGWGDLALRNADRQPQLVPQDNRTRAVYTRLEMPQDAPIRPDNREQQPRQPVPVTGLEFVGKCSGKGKAAFLLLYPTEEEVRLAEDKEKKLPARTVRRRGWAEVPVELDFDKAAKVPAAADIQNRKASLPPTRGDLEGLWASAQATRFAVLETLAPEFSFYGYAREATGRKYGVPTPSLQSNFRFIGNGQADHRRLYETTTGAAAIAESLQMQRMLTTDFRDNGPRKVDIKKVPGIDIAEHPWQKMMGDKKPSPEPLAQLVPHDNYYIHFKNIRKFIEMGELFDQWGTSLVRAYEIHSRDYQLKERYERQLCLRSTVLGKTLGPLVIRGLAITGSDPYVREGSDVTLIFQVVNQDLFLGAVNTFVAEARKEWGDRLKEGKEEYHKVTIESFVTPLREVSLYRASIGDFVIYSNSPAGIRRVIDTQQGRSKALADSLDFQYMRTIFRLEDQQEDGFAFLSDPFIRNLVGPTSKIKEKRRLEALTSLHMTTNDALFTAWETGKLPAAPKNLYVSAVLKPEEIYVPDGKGVTWDDQRKLAASDVYNTLQFATPLVELPIDFITETEERDYLQFRGEYLGLWRRYFDPIGMRFALNDQQVRVDTYILPLIQNSQYNELRRRTGGGTTPLDIKGFAPSTLFQMVTHISPDAPERNDLKQGLMALGALGKNKGVDWLGDWFMVRLDDSPVYGKLAELQMRRELDPEAPPDWDEQLRLVFQMPVTVGVSIKNPLVFAGVLTGLRGAVNNAAPDAVTWAALDPAYKGVSIVRIQAKADGMIGREANRNGGKDPFLPALYYAQVDGGFYISFREECIKEVIDRSVARKEGKLPKAETVPINSSIYVAPGAADKTRGFINHYLEMQCHRQALANASFWYALYRAGVIPDGASEEARQKTALSFLGFVPVSAEGAAYAYEAKTDEVVNRRHGSLRKPQKHATLADNSPLAKLLDQLQTVRADLRFREDGVHTVLTIERTRK
jgi:hypothetical protein